MAYPHHLDLCIDEQFFDERNRDYHARQIELSRQIQDSPVSRDKMPATAHPVAAAIVLYGSLAIVLGVAVAAVWPA